MGWDAWALCWVFYAFACYVYKALGGEDRYGMTLFQWKDSKMTFGGRRGVGV